MQTKYAMNAQSTEEDKKENGVGRSFLATQLAPSSCHSRRKSDLTSQFPSVTPSSHPRNMSPTSGSQFRSRHHFHPGCRVAFPFAICLHRSTILCVPIMSSCMMKRMSLRPPRNVDYLRQRRYSNTLVIPRERYHFFDKWRSSSHKPNIYQAHCVRKRQNAQNGPCKQRHSNTTSHLKCVANLEFREGALLLSRIPSLERSNAPRLRSGRGTMAPRRAVCVLIWLWMKM
jgi:hypothetical protein